MCMTLSCTFEACRIRSGGLRVSQFQASGGTRNLRSRASGLQSTTQGNCIRTIRGLSSQKSSATTRSGGQGAAARPLYRDPVRVLPSRRARSCFSGLNFAPKQGVTPKTTYMICAQTYPVYTIIYHIIMISIICLAQPLEHLGRETVGRNDIGRVNIGREHTVEKCWKRTWPCENDD